MPRELGRRQVWTARARGRGAGPRERADRDGHRRPLEVRDSVGEAAPPVARRSIHPARLYMPGLGDEDTPVAVINRISAIASG